MSFLLFLFLSLSFSSINISISLIKIILNYYKYTWEPAKYFVPNTFSFYANFILFVENR